MAYETLLNKFLENETYLYGKNPLTGDEKIGWYVEIRPGSTALLQGGDPFLDTRSIPVVSGARDVKRITRFLFSGKGLLFLGKQALLQTGNTFGQTRLLNPLFVAKQLIPFTHSPRHASNIPLIISLVSKTLGAKPPGGLDSNRLQKETVTNIRTLVRSKTAIPTKAKLSFSNIIDTITSPFKALTSVIGGATINANERPEIKYQGFLDYIDIERIRIMGSEFPRTPSFSINPKTDPIVKQSQDTRYFVSAAAKYTIEKVRKLTTFEFTGLPTRPELSPSQFAFIPNFGNIPVPGTNKIDNVEQTLTDLNSSFQKQLTKYIYDPKSFVGPGSPTKSITVARSTQMNKNKLKYNVDTIAPTDILNKQIFATIEQPDYIIFTFEAAGKKVQLRSFIVDFGTTVEAEYTEDRYVGRYEKFLTYIGVNRKIDLSFYLIPHNSNEVDVVWGKLDWLTRLAYPTGIQSSGYFEPPLTKLTVGRVFDRLPVFVKNISWKLEDTSTWDIDKEVPLYIKVNMQISIIESALNTLQRGALYEIVKNPVFIGRKTPTVKTTTYVEPKLRPAPSTFPVPNPIIPSRSEPPDLLGIGG